MEADLSLPNPTFNFLGKNNKNHLDLYFSCFDARGNLVVNV